MEISFKQTIFSLDAKNQKNKFNLKNGIKFQTNFILFR